MDDELAELKGRLETVGFEFKMRTARRDFWSSEVNQLATEYELLEDRLKQLSRRKTALTSKSD